MKTKMFILVFVVLTMGYVTLHCQDNKSETREVYIQRMQKNEFDKYKLTEKKLNRLKEIGIDLRSNKAASLEIIRSIYTDAVVVVKIIAILDWPGPAEQLFHTKIKACIQEVLKGKAVVGDTIELLQKSGPLVGSGEANRIAVSTDVGFCMGEESIIYLRRMNKDSFLTSSGNRKGFDLGNFESDSTRFYVSRGSKIIIKNGKCLIGGKTVDASQFKSDIKKIDVELKKIDY
jgi:hypothetical protein